MSVHVVVYGVGISFLSDLNNLGEPARLHLHSPVFFSENLN